MPRKESERYLRVKENLDLPVAILALVLLGVIIVREFFLLSSEISLVLHILDWFIWVVFVFELTVLTSLSRNKLNYLVRHWYDVLIVIFPPARIFRLIRLSYLENIGILVGKIIERLFGSENAVVRLIPLLFKTAHNIKKYFRSHKINYIFAVTIVIVLILGSLVVLIERDVPNARIHNIQDGVWWSIETITTVGYGDFFPVSSGGKIVAVVIMAFGITMFSLLTASLSSYLFGEHELKLEKKIDERLADIEKKLDSLLEK